jgi:hypothetical protein
MNNFSKNISRIAKILLVGCLAFLFAQEAQAQDKIYKKSGKILNVKIIEIGVEDIRYRQQDQPDGVIYAIEKIDVEKVVLENGLTQRFEQDNLVNSEIYADQRKQALKISFLAPLVGYTRFTYERAIKPGHSWEAKLGIIGLGRKGGLFDISSNQAGAFLAAGYKFILQPDYRTARQRYTHILKGSYFSPEIAFGAYSQDATSYSWLGTTTTTKVRTNYGCVVLSFGKQWVINDIFLIDIAYGLGYGSFSRSNNSNESLDIAGGYGYTVLSNGLVSASKLNIGILLNNPKKKNNK